MRKILSPVHSATCPLVFSISPSPAFTRFASIFAWMLATYLPVDLMRGSTVCGIGTRVETVITSSPLSYIVCGYRLSASLETMTVEGPVQLRGSSPRVTPRVTVMRL